MSLNTLETSYVNGEIIDASHINELTLSLLGAFVGRDAGGIPTPLQSLGTLAIPWGNLYANGIILDGQAIDTSQITSRPNRIVSGQTRPLSSLGDFIRANGAALEFDVLGATDNLILSINNAAVSVTADLNKTGVTAAPSTNNTADINDTTITNDLYVGEDDRDITIDAVGTEISTRVGQIAAFQTPTGEIFQALIKNATTLTNAKRGFYFDDTGTPIQRGNLSNNDTITFLNIGWVFVEDNGTTVDVTYRTPVVDFQAPTSPSTGDYWFDISNQVWKRYSGASFDIINRMLIGQVVSDDTNTIASRSADFNNNFEEQNNMYLEVFSSEIIKSKKDSSRVNVYGTEVQIENTKTDWNITIDLESGLSEAASTYYSLYLSDRGETIISDKRPHDRPELKGKYHPYESWRFIGESFNDSSNDLINALDDNTKIFARYTTDAGASVDSGNTMIFEDKDTDNSSGYNTSTGVMTIRRTTRIKVDALRAENTATSWVFSIFVNGIQKQETSQPVGANGASLTLAFLHEFDAKFGDTVEIRNSGGSSKVSDGDAVHNILQITEV